MNEDLLAMLAQELERALVAEYFLHDVIGSPLRGDFK
jgi:hypothetical protein